MIVCLIGDGEIIVMKFTRENDWQSLLSKEFEKLYYQELTKILENEYSTKTIYPEKAEIFQAMYLTPYEETKVVLLGQDPYHGNDQAHGLSFSVKKGVKPPPSLINIFKEYKTDLGFEHPQDGCLTKWAEEGVLLLNTVLTVRESLANSHKGLGWEPFTNEVISLLNKRQKPVVFLLWGKHAQEKKRFITSKQHFIIESPHPSPLSAHRGFFGSRPFSKVNSFLRSVGQGEIDWKL